jgi:hypothetical protein
VRVLHAHWRPSSPDGALLFWAEVQPDEIPGRSSRKQPFCADAGNLRDLLGETGAEAETFTLLLPGNSRRPFPSPQLRGAELGRRGRRALRAWEVQGLRPGRAVEVLMRLLEPGSLSPDVRLGDSLRYWQRAGQLALEALAG